MTDAIISSTGPGKSSGLSHKITAMPNTIQPSVLRVFFLIFITNLKSLPPLAAIYCLTIAQSVMTPAAPTGNAIQSLSIGTKSTPTAPKPSSRAAAPAMPVPSFLTIAFMLSPPVLLFECYLFLRFPLKTIAAVMTNAEPIIIHGSQSVFFVQYSLP